MLLGVPSSLAKKVKYLSFFGREIVVINTELSSYLDPPILEGRVYSVRYWLRVRKLNGF